MHILLILIAIGIACALVLNALYKRTNHFQSQFVDVRKFWKTSARQDNLQVVNLGSNHPKFGFDYSETGIRGENWAVGPQTFEYDFAILRQNARYLTPGATVVIPVCLLNFFLYRQKSRAIHAKYYSFLPKEDIVDYSWIEKLMVYDLPLLFHPKRVRFIFRDVKPDNLLGLSSNPMTTDEELKNDGLRWINCWNDEFDIKLPDPVLTNINKQDISHNIRILKQMLEYCKSNNYRPVIAILPVTTYLSSLFTDEFIKTHILKYIDEANVINAPAFNYLKDERFTDSSLYINTFFMNKKGRNLFTNVFVNECLRDYENCSTQSAI